MPESPNSIEFGIKESNDPLTGAVDMEIDHFAHEGNSEEEGVLNTSNCWAGGR